jgi:hypothetical protein
MMQVRCQRCGWSFTLGRDAIGLAVVEAEHQHDTHYLFTCPKCRHGVKVQVKQLRQRLPPDYQFPDLPQRPAPISVKKDEPPEAVTQAAAAPPAAVQVEPQPKPAVKTAAQPKTRSSARAATEPVAKPKSAAKTSSKAAAKTKTATKKPGAVKKTAKKTTAQKK